MKRNTKLFGMKPFLLLWGSQAVSALGSAMTSYALMLWSYQQTQTASSIAWLSICSALPSIILAIAAGTLADRWDKKKIMLISDAAAALGTVAVLILYQAGSLALWHLYIVNTLISLMNAFQSPAAYVAVTLITPKDQYTRAGGLQSLSGSLVKILSPAAAAAVLAFANLETVLVIDLATFSVAFLTLLFVIKIPPVPQQGEAEGKLSFWKNCREGLQFLLSHKPLWHLILFFAGINFLASLGANGLLSAMILARTGSNSVILGTVTSAVGAGALAGSLLVTIAKPPKKRMPVIFLCCALSFLINDIPLALGRGLWVWVPGAFLSNAFLPPLNANLSTVMRNKVPLELQGRVFAARDTFQYTSIPIGYALAGLLADHVMEPFMAGDSLARQALSKLVGTGAGSGMAVMILVSGLVGAAASLLALSSKGFRSLDE